MILNSDFNSKRFSKPCFYETHNSHPPLVCEVTCPKKCGVHFFNLTEFSFNKLTESLVFTIT